MATAGSKFQKKKLDDTALFLLSIRNALSLLGGDGFGVGGDGVGGIAVQTTR
jgi:hypothetical protein